MVNQTPLWEKNMSTGSLVILGSRVNAAETQPDLQHIVLVKVSIKGK